MTFLWPHLLWLMLAVPALVAVYLWLLRRRGKSAVRFTSVAMIKAAITPGHRLRRHLPPLLLLLGVSCALFAAARPAATVTLPSQHKTVILAIDVSLSMRAADVEPDRITAAQAAARSFVEEQPPNTRIGIVAFGAAAALVAAPTSDKRELLEAIDRFQLQRGTATGSALMVSLSTLFPDGGYDVESLVYGARGTPGGRERNTPLERGKPGTGPKEFEPVAPGSYESATIILLSDGRRTTGPDPLEIARLVADRGVRVFTVGFGTVEGAQIGFEGWSIYVKLDEETLKAIATITRGEYFHAATSEDLKKVYQTLNSKLVLERKMTELSALFALAAVLLVAAAGLLSIWWASPVQVAQARG